MKNNYPIKYAVMPIIEQTGWYPGLHELEREYGIVCYIVSKCYVVGREEKYNRYGNTICEYKVVFSYGKDNQYGDLSRVEPEFCLMNGRCNNSTNVDKVFDSFEEAKEETEKKNKEILSKELSYIRVDDNFHQNVSLVREKHEEVVSYYQEIENMIEEDKEEEVIESIQGTYEDEFGENIEDINSNEVSQKENNIMIKVFVVITIIAGVTFGIVRKKLKVNQRS